MVSTTPGCVISAPAATASRRWLPGCGCLIIGPRNLHALHGRIPMRMSLVAASVMSLALGAPAVRADTAAELLQAAKDALKSGEPKKALELATKAIEQDPKEPKAYFLRGRVHELLQENK